MTMHKKVHELLDLVERGKIISFNIDSYPHKVMIHATNKGYYDELLEQVIKLFDGEPKFSSLSLNGYIHHHASVSTFLEEENKKALTVLVVYLDKLEVGNVGS